MAGAIQHVRGTSAAWIAANPVLPEGEIGIVTDTMAYKIGDGVTAWNSLAYRELSPAVSALVMTAIADPSTPGAGYLNLYTKSIAGRLMVKVKGPSGLDTAIQPAIFQNGMIVISPGNSTAFSVVGHALPTAVGTVSHPALSASNQRTQTRRGILTSAATANSVAESRIAATICWRGDSPGLGGFFHTTRFAISSSTANQRCFAGFTSSTSATAATQNPSSLTNCLIAGWDSADSNLQVMYNDAAGACTKIDLGTDFPANTPDAIYELTLFAKPNDTSVFYRVVRLDTGSMTEGELTSNLPASTTFLAWHAYANNGGTAAAVVLELMRMYTETDY